MLATAMPSVEAAGKKHSKAGVSTQAAKATKSTAASKHRKQAHKQHSKQATKVHKRLARHGHRHHGATVHAAVPAVVQASGNALKPSQSVVQETPAGTNLGLRSAAALVVDQKTGEALYAKNADVQTPIASITKLMTSLVVLDKGQSLSERITVSDADVDRLKSTHSRLPVGATLTRGELMNLALIASENRAAAALARSYPGGAEACIKAMNRKATELAMTSTHYVDGTGLSSGNRSTAADLAKLVNVASGNPTIRQITSTGEYGIDLPGYRTVRVRQHGKTRRVSREVERRVAFHNTNVLTRDPDWEIGLSKTGFINEAGHCLVMQTRIADRKVIMVLLDSEGKMTRIGDANRVRRWLQGEAG
ncbi:MAG: peptidase [Hydrogenophilales bacterium CG15_BIG_FIL_POST_REV_8_21_14_020_62_31]|nr:MAG: peptidase [Hydrogenophilales bacterium CG15_BIG_FIL_POST_REV_8_21_14_020_62_31]